MRAEPTFGIRSLRAPPERIGTAHAQETASRYWGVGGVATALPAEVDENFRLVGAEGEFLLKVVSGGRAGGAHRPRHPGP